MNAANAGRVVVGIGESLAALQALRHAVAEARLRRCPLRGVRVWQASVPWRGYDVDRCRDQAGAAADATIRRCFESAMGGLPADLDFELTAVEGPEVGPALVEQATNDNDLLVLGGPRSGAGGARERSSCIVTACAMPAARSWSCRRRHSHGNTHRGAGPRDQAGHQPARQPRVTHQRSWVERGAIRAR